MSLKNRSTRYIIQNAVVVNESSRCTVRIVFNVARYATHGHCIRQIEVSSRRVTLSNGHRARRCGSDRQTGRERQIDRHTGRQTDAR